MVLSPITNRQQQQQLPSSASHRATCERPLADVANKIHIKDNTSLSTRTPDTAKSSTRQRQHRSIQPKVIAVPFPTISEEPDDVDVDAVFTYNPEVEAARGREWAKEIARRQENIKELRDKKLRLEQAHAAARPRKSQQQKKHITACSYLTSGDRKLSGDDLEFVVALHASVVWRLWHADLTPEVFASERLLATRLHLALMRNGRMDLPVPPIVALSKSHHLHLTHTPPIHTHTHTHSTQSFSTRHMIEKDRPGIMTLPQLVAKSFLRQSQGQTRRGRRSPSRGRSSECTRRSGQHPSSPLARETATQENNVVVVD